MKEAGMRVRWCSVAAGVRRSQAMWSLLPWGVGRSQAVPAAPQPPASPPVLLLWALLLPRPCPGSLLPPTKKGGIQPYIIAAIITLSAVPRIWTEADSG